MTFVPIRQYSWGSAQGLQWCRNGRYPDAAFQSFLARELNHLARCRVKELASFCVPVASIPGGEADGNDRHRWRFAFHSSPFAKYVWVHFVLATNANDYNPGARLRILTTAGATFGDAEYFWGDSETSAVIGPSHFGNGKSTLVSAGAAVPITADTDFTGRFTDLGSGRLIAACAYEWSLDSDTANGYLVDGYSSSSPIYDEDRGDAITMARNLWKRQAGQLWNWSGDRDNDSPTRTSATAINVIDNSSTTVSAATPGVTLDLTNRTTVSRSSTGVPCVFAVYGGVSAGTTGTVVIKDSTGAVVATCTNFTTTEGWVTTTCNLPATVAKYDVHFYSNGVATFTVRAFSLYQYLA